MTFTKNKKLIILSATIVLLIIIVLRIIYVNFHVYKYRANNIYNIGQIADYNGIEIKCINKEFISGKDISKKYNIDQDGVDDYNLIFTIDLKNISQNAKYLDVSSVCMKYGNVSGGNINPYLFPILNKDIESSKIILNSNESSRITLAFPLKKEYKRGNLIISLFPYHTEMKIF